MLTLKEIQRQIRDLTSLWKWCEIRGMQNHGSIFYLFKFADLLPHIHHNNSKVCFSPFHHPFVLHSIYEILKYCWSTVFCTNFWSTVVINFNVELKIYLYMHGSNNIFLVLQFLLTIPSSRRKRAGYLG